MPRRYTVLDVFTDKALAGNPLAVVQDAEGLDTAAMQSIAREFNLSETVFVFPPKIPESGGMRHRAALRIFTPARELPFAGHPTVGTAVLLGLRDGEGRGDFIIEETVGPVSCTATQVSERVGTARFALPKLPEAWGEGVSAEACAAGLGLAATEIGFDRHRPSCFSAGVPFDLVPIATLEAIGRAKPQGGAFEGAFGGSGRSVAYLYTRETAEAGHHFHARMFGAGMGIAEDPATGAAAAAFAGAIVAFEALGDGEHRMTIEQGYEMGRPSQIGLTVVMRGGALVSAAIEGSAVVVAEGALHA